MRDSTPPRLLKNMCRKAKRRTWSNCDCRAGAPSSGTGWRAGRRAARPAGCGPGRPPAAGRRRWACTEWTWGQCYEWFFYAKKMAIILENYIHKIIISRNANNRKNSRPYNRPLALFFCKPSRFNPSSKHSPLVASLKSDLCSMRVYPFKYL
jgi:hypothetical protein